MQHIMKHSFTHRALAMCSRRRFFVSSSSVTKTTPTRACRCCCTGTQHARTVMSPLCSSIRTQSFSTTSSQQHGVVHEQQQQEQFQFVDSVIQDRISRGELHEDAAQERAARRLTRLQKALVGYTNESLLEYNQFLRKIKQEEKEKEQQNENEIEDGREENESSKSNESKYRQKDLDKPSNQQQQDEDQLQPQFSVPRGLFLYGEVGTGKSMLMDTFYHQAPLRKKQRVHFHAFMHQVHQSVFDLKQQDLQRHGRNFSVDVDLENNPIVRVANQLSKDVTLLCLDEFQVTDVADALMLRQLFETLWANGTVLVATSNRPPSDLYEGGLNRSYFLPFIDVLEKQCIVHKMQSDTDYRQIITNDDDLHNFYLLSDDEESTRVCNEIFTKLRNGREPTSIDLTVGFNRTLTVPRADKNGAAARFDFADLCDEYLGAADYRAIAQAFDVVILEEIPRLTLKQHDKARRFITLVDELYENKCALMCTAAAPPNELFVGQEEQEVNDSSMERKVGEMFGIDVAQSSGKTAGELASVRELPFAFRRASSRLIEMCSRQWWDKVL